MKEIIILFIFTILVVLFGIFCSKKCIEYHYEDVYYPQYQTLIFIGKMPLTQFHPAYTSNEKICDKYE